MWFRWVWTRQNFVARWVTNNVNVRIKGKPMLKDISKIPLFSHVFHFLKNLFLKELRFLKTLPWWLLGKSLKYRNWIGSLPKSEKFLKPSNIYQAVLNFSEILVIVPDSCSLSQFRYSQVSNCKGIYQREEGWAFGETKNSNNSNTNE